MSDWLMQLEQERAIAVLRAPSLTLGLAMAEAAVAGGLQMLEITLNSDCALELIDQCRQRFPRCWVGAGTILSRRDVLQVLSAGAQFGFSPVLALEALELSQLQDFPMVLGGLTPSEVVQAWQAGAAAVKVFPVSALGGSAYVRSLLEPLGSIPLVPTGGVNVGNAAGFLQAGAIAVGLSGGLFPKALIKAQDWGQVTGLARQLKLAISLPELVPA